jgi:hypothetical protein
MVFRNEFGTNGYTVMYSPWEGFGHSLLKIHTSRETQRVSVANVYSGPSLWSAFERVGGGVVWRVTRVKHCDQMGQDYGRYGSFTQWRYGTVGLLAGVNPVRHTHTHTQTTDRISPKSDASQNVDRPAPSFEDFVLLEYGVASLDVSTKLSSSEVSGFLPRCIWGVRSSGTTRRRRVVGRLPIFRDNMSHLDP